MSFRSVNFPEVRSEERFKTRMSPLGSMLSRIRLCVVLKEIKKKLEYSRNVLALLGERGYPVLVFRPDELVTQEAYCRWEHAGGPPSTNFHVELESRGMRDILTHWMLLLSFDMGPVGVGQVI